MSAGTLVLSWQTAAPHAPLTAGNQTGTPIANHDTVAPEGETITVITTDPPAGNSGPAAIIALTNDGQTLYHDGTYSNYFDVDPDPPGSRTVLYVAGNRFDQCPTRLEARSNETFGDGCAEVVVERVNISTRETERVHTAVTAWDIWHDVDRISKDRLLVGDLSQDRVFILNTSTDRIEWEWQAEAALDPDSGGQAGDWTHVNDVELLDDGRIMVSLRNQDRVGFLDPDSGFQEAWTLGAENAYGTLYEQHNPDYIPVERGGPAVVVADSENNRGVEYRRINGRWREVWAWTDARLRWPRDADRLPGGHTLVTDSQGNRVLELNESDEVIWHVDVPTPYEAERLGTGDESATGWSTTAQRNGTQQAVDARPTEPTDRTTGVAWIVSFITGPMINGLLYVAPPWVTFRALGAALVFGMTTLAWTVFELYWYVSA